MLSWRVLLAVVEHLDGVAAPVSVVRGSARLLLGDWVLTSHFGDSCLTVVSWHIAMVSPALVEEAEVLGAHTWLLPGSLVRPVRIVKSSGVNLVILPLKVVVIAVHGLLFLLSEESLLLLGEHLLMLPLDLGEFLLGIVVDSSQLLFIVLVDNILDLLDVFGLDGMLVDALGGDDWHLLWSPLP